MDIIEKPMFEYGNPDFDREYMNWPTLYTDLPALHLGRYTPP